MVTNLAPLPTSRSKGSLLRSKGSGERKESRGNGLQNTNTRDDSSSSSSGNSDSSRKKKKEEEEKDSNNDGATSTVALNNRHSSNSKTATPASATLNEALRNNPFGNTSRSRALASEVHQSTEESHEAPSKGNGDDDDDGNSNNDDTSPVAQLKKVQDLNGSLVILSHLFPDVRIEVFRELLMRFDGESRLHLCVEQLLRHKKDSVQGRWKLPVDPNQKDDGRYDEIPQDELFRTSEYKDTVKLVLCKEFGALSRSAIDAVLAEVNFSYIKARPILKDLSRKSWRAALSNLNPFRRKKDKDENPLVAWDRSAEGDLRPRLKNTGSEELDQELHEALVLPYLREQREIQKVEDFLLALQLTEQEARTEDALFECQCCLDDVPFEQISTCSADGHVICFSCIRRTMHEALFGQGWDNSVSSAKSTLKCVAPVSSGVCDGHLDPTLIKQAILLDKAGSETYRKFEERVASEALLQSRMKLVQCPFCSYAEVDPVFHPPTGQGLAWRYRRGNILITILTTIFFLDLIPLLIIPLLIPLLFYPGTISAIFRTSLQNISLRSRSKRFTCKNLACQRASCITCRKSWRDPHSCEEPLQQSLRTTVEAARTAAVKRTCPRCNVSFVKSSGCNKLTCVCGYSMCYLCRKSLNGSPRRGGGTANNNNNNINQRGNRNADVGYKHFCEHFRVVPGARCTECNKCDLYRAEDEEAIARRAGEKAEREWRMRQSLITKQPTATASSTTISINNDEGKELPLPSSIDTASSSSSSSPWDPDSAQQEQHLLLTSVLKNNHIWHMNSWRYWFYEVWKDGRWKWEVQAAADMIAEKIIVVDV